MGVDLDENWVCTESTFLLISTQNPRYIAQWLERMTADQQVPGSIPGGDHGSTLIGIFSGTIL